LLTDDQIERYSRQIILPEVGGLGQERLLGSRIALLAEIEDLTPALSYLAGAGIGVIRIISPQRDGAMRRAAAEALELNPEVRVEVSDQEAQNDETLVILAATDPIVEAARRMNLSAARRQVVFARLGEPYLVAVLESRPPCLACAHRALLADVGQPGPLAAAVAMLAVAETIKSLLAVAPLPSRLIEFSGYESRSRELGAARQPHCRICG
jgi:molybdopterin/thiamine biosynthesis adenylyltransferase